MRILLHLLLLATLAVPALAKEARVYLTARDTGDRLTARGAVVFEALPQPSEGTPVVMVDPDKTFQTIEGIGGALTDAAAETFAKLPPDKQAEVIKAYWDPREGIGYTLARTHINSCDFSSASYAYAPPGDVQLARFDIAPDLRYRIPFIRKVLARAPDLKIFISPWSPPAWMKDNANMLQGGKLLPRYADAWARYYVRFVEEYRKQGIPIWGLTVQNEPMAKQTWESCIYTAEEERDFVKRHLGPALHQAGMADLKLMMWDHNRGLMQQRAAVMLDDPEAARYVWGIAFHWYDGDRFESQTVTHDMYPDKPQLFTEGCNYPFSWETFDQWHWGENYAHSMINDFNRWCVGWTDWNVLLDEIGGPNHVKNYCFAPVHADTRKGTVHYMNSYYYIGHFSKFVRPGARRVACTSIREELEATAFKNLDGSVVTVVLNRTDKPIEARVWSAGQAAPVSLPARSIATVIF